MRVLLGISLLFLIFFCGFVRAGDVTVTLIGTDPLIINIKGDTQDEEAGNISIYLYFRDDGVTDLEESGVNSSQITGTEPGQFGWPTIFEKKEIQGEGQLIEGGPWIRDGHTFTKRLFYDNVDIGGQDDYWTTSGINAIVDTFTTRGPGHIFIELAGPDGLGDYQGIPHNVTFLNQGIPVSVGTPTTLEVPREFRLHPNYPNPFNPTTTLRFDIPRIGTQQIDVKLIIYNSLGQLIKTLYNGKQGPGSYNVQWDGTTDFGGSAPSGIYFAIFRTDRFFQTRKLVLLK